MRTAVIVYSQTGNTLSVAVKLVERLKAGGTEAHLVRLEPIGEVHPGVESIAFKNMPDLSGYDSLVFASPVQAFSLCSAMSAFLRQADLPRGARAAFFVTQFFPFRWMGGSNALGQMKGLIERKGIEALPAGVVNWSRKDREARIDSVTEAAFRILTAAM